MRITLELKPVPATQSEASPARGLQTLHGLSLRAWAEKTFGEYAPRYSTLRKWALEGRISPQPQKDGWNWLVDANAQYRDKS